MLVPGRLVRGKKIGRLPLPFHIALPLSFQGSTINTPLPRCLYLSFTVSAPNRVLLITAYAHRCDSPESCLWTELVGFGWTMVEEDGAIGGEETVVPRRRLLRLREADRDMVPGLLDLAGGEVVVWVGCLLFRAHIKCWHGKFSCCCGYF